MRKFGVLGAVVSLVIAGVLAASPAQADHHLIKITEIFGGSSMSPNAQFVELQMYAPGQNITTNQKVIFYDHAGVAQTEKTFFRNMPNGTDQSHILLASSEAEELFGVSADLGLSGEEIELEGGKICWGTEASIIDCASWGNYGAEDLTGGAKTGTPFNMSGPLPLDQSMTRKISGGTDPSKLDAGDDTNDSAADFEFASPTPESNGDAPESSPSASPPPVVRHKRVVSLKLSGKLVASGLMEVEDDFEACFSNVPVSIQRKQGRKWKSVKSTHTDAQGSYSVAVPNKPGTYRSKAKGFSADSTDTCLAVKSKQVTH